MAGKTQKIAQSFPPGDFLLEELEAHGWTQKDFARVIGRPIQTVNQIVKGNKRITPETAVEIAAALGTSAEFWLNLENEYRLSLVGEPDPAIRKRARALAA